MLFQSGPSFRRTPESSEVRRAKHTKPLCRVLRTSFFNWIPAFAGMTSIGSEALKNLKFGALTLALPCTQGRELICGVFVAIEP
jgi:hypothetical protein